MHPLVPRYLQHPTAEQLAEIYRLRVTAWTPDPDFDARQFPNGLADELDPTAHHWIIEDSNQIIAAARVAIVRHLAEIPHWQLFGQCQFPKFSPFAYLSRLVVHPSHQGKGWSKQFDEARLFFIDKADIPLTICYSTLSRQRQLEKQSFIPVGHSDIRFDFTPTSCIVQYRLHPNLSLIFPPTY